MEEVSAGKAALQTATLRSTEMQGGDINGDTEWCATRVTVGMLMPQC